MGVARYELYTTVLAPRGRIVHAVDLHKAGTVCGKRMRGAWKLSTRLLGCRDCKLAIDLDCRTKRAKRRPRKRTRR